MKSLNEKNEEIICKIFCPKYVEHSQLEDYYKITIYEMYKGDKFFILEEKDDKISITNWGGDYRVWLSLGIKYINKVEYQKWVDKNEAELLIERKEL